MGKQIGDVLMALVMVAALFLMVRPGSNGVSFVKALTGGFSDMVKASTGGGTWGNK